MKCPRDPLLQGEAGLGLCLILPSRSRLHLDDFSIVQAWVGAHRQWMLAAVSVLHALAAVGHP